MKYLKELINMMWDHDRRRVMPPIQNTSGEKLQEMDGPPGKITHWKCDTCGDMRPDRLVSILSYPLKDLPGGERNYKYCNDRNYCYEVAITRSKKGQI